MTRTVSPATAATPTTTGRPAAVDGRALTARSVVASTLLGMSPPRLSSQLLVRSGELFGIAEGTTRVALSRMVGAGELEPDGGAYRLAGHLLARQARQEASRRGIVDDDRWNGDWELRVVRGTRRDARARGHLRDAMRQLKRAEVREGFWLRPGNLPADRSPDAETAVLEQCMALTGRPDHSDPAVLATELWDLDSWARRANELRTSMDSFVGDLEVGDTSVLAPTFVLAAAVLRHLVADPQLPAELCPPAWPGSSLRTDYERFDRAFKAVWRAWFGGQTEPA